MCGGYDLDESIKQLGDVTSNWLLPQGDIGGISLKGWVEIRAEFRRLAQSILRKGDS